MANSLRAKLSKLRHDGHITDAEYQAFIKKLDGHDAEIRNNAIDEFAEVLREYQSLGTVEEIQKAIENLPLHQVEHKLLQEYQTIGTVRECKIAVERMKPKKPIDKLMYLECPSCGDVGIEDCGYCSACGQKLDWE